MAQAHSEEQVPILLEKLREQLKDDSDKHLMRMDDEFLAKFIRVRDFDVDRAGVAVRNYYKYIDRNADRLHGISPTQFIDVYETKMTILLKQRCKIGSKVALQSIGQWNPKKWAILDLQRAYSLLIEDMIEDKETQLNGLSLICDYDGFSLSHVTALTPGEVKRFVMNMQDGFPMKITSVHFINYPTLFWGIYFIAQRFLKEKIRKRIHFHANLDSLHEYFDKEGLPKKLGGLLEMEESMDRDGLEELIRKNVQYEEYHKPNFLVDGNGNGKEQMLISTTKPMAIG